jgi:hypothetical protein
MAPGKSRLLVRAGSALALVLLLAACTPGGQFDPTEVVSSDIFNTKKKIAGEREPLFPNGVPGTETGVPPDLVKGYQPPPEQPAATADATPASAAAAEAKPQPKPKHKPKPKVARAAAPTAHDRAFDQRPASAVPQTQQPGQAAWPNSPPPTAQTNWPAPAASGQSQQQAGSSAQTNWPAAPASGQSQPAQPAAQASWPAQQPQAQTNWPDPSTLGKQH